MKFNYGLSLLITELERSTDRKNAAEKIFGDSGGGRALRQFTESLKEIEDLQEAIEILKREINGNGRNKSSDVAT
jgi:hypothetical protein